MALIESGINMPDEISDNAELARRKAAVDRILSKSVKIISMTAADLVRAGRKERDLNDLCIRDRRWRDKNGSDSG